MSVFSSRVVDRLTGRRVVLRTLGSIALLLMLVNCPAGASLGSLRITVLGDSLTAGYGLPEDASFPRLLERALLARGYDVEVENAGVSGDTTAGGRARLEWVLAAQPDVVIVELGANDALRGLEPSTAEDNLDAILSTLRRRHVQVLLAGMRAPRNLGRAYASSFDAIFPRLAKRYGVVLYPFFLEGVAGVPALNQVDGIHPNERGVSEIVRRILPSVIEVIDGATRDRGP